MTYRTTVHRADHGMGIAPPEGGFWRPLIMTQGSNGSGAPVITILWEQVSEREPHQHYPVHAMGGSGVAASSGTGGGGYVPGHQGEAAFKHEYGGPGDNPPGDLGNEVR